MTTTEDNNQEAYQSDQFSLFPPEELKKFHEFHSYDWDNDAEFQKGLKAIYSTIPTDEKELLKAKQFYFSRIKYPIDLDNYLQFEKILNSSKPEFKEDDSVYARFDEYSFSTDEKFLSGLPNIITGLAKNKPGAIVDKAFYDREMLKARAFYYSRFVENLDLAEYLSWKEAKKVAPACPYAHLWQNKGIREEEEHSDSNEFINVEHPQTSLGALTLSIASPQTNNLMTSERLRLLKDEVDQAMSDPKHSALIITTRCSQIAVPEQDPDAPITNFDHKTISAGLALKETLLECDDDIEAVQNSLQSLQNDYYSLVKLLERKDESSKPVFNIIDGEIPRSASLFYLSPNQTRIITEHAFTHFGINSYSNAPIPPLGLLKCILDQDKSARVPPKGTALYISLAPPNLLLLRGPELLRLGMADYFIPDAKYVDTLKEMKNNAPCPAPHTEEAIKVVLEMHKAYAGPDKIGVWQKEIEQVFGDFPSVSQILERLRDIKKPWSDGILQHLEKQSPSLLEVVVRAVNQVMKEAMPLEACLDLEQQLNVEWRRTEDFKLVVEDQIGEMSGHISSWLDLDSDVVNRMFLEPTTLVSTAEDKIKEYRLVMPSTESNEERESVETATTKTSEDDDEIFVCPVTGMRGKMPTGHAPVALQPTV
ncbi:hypothetical protein K450DRAFT_239391 [Umbelopsis ramanniana AG]|uniref:Uncharacterized protein n=1 Tax=Umbelopsis ramanniana AG TaxID=1314678 RepID=A0AAD5EBX4_UMBRA|nr:uncharacterized protein K450DRAFT_239391 [Umbelopsis ramanniana AG]KAI8580100.1 hypothetical protein K450DRAFT_239391 [Umbelopsis ramanniana AG]